MRIARFSAAGEVGFGLVDFEAGDTSADGATAATVAELSGHPFAPVVPSGVRHRLDDVRLLAPVLPSKVVAVGRNYAEHARELGEETPEAPLIFLKPSTSVIGPGDAIAYPKQSRRVDHEGELAVVIGRLCRDVPPERAQEVVLGYTCANDVTARDLQRGDGQWARAKGFDSFCPLGPWVETELDVADVAVTCTVNGEARQEGRTAQLTHDIPALIAYVSSVMTLLPGDVLLTGTPAGVGPLEIGDEVSVTVEGIGTLTNRVVRRD